MRKRGMLVAGLLTVLALPAAASADHHLLLIREFYPGTAATANDAFLELQMYAPGQNLVGGHEIYVYPPGSTTPPPFVLNPLAPPPPNAESQRTILAGGTNGPSPRDYTENLDSAPMDPSGGAVCFVSTEGFGPIDCVEWGTGTTAVNAGTPVLPAGIPDGSSITRSIAPNCATLLEKADDTDDSATDFALTAPTPRANAVAPTETSCSGGGGGGGGEGGGGGDADPPQTKITKGPKGKIEKSKTRFGFKSDEADSRFQCKRDRRRWKPCDSPKKLKRLDDGRHRFKVRAIDPAGNIDPTPAKRRFEVRS